MTIRVIAAAAVALGVVAGSVHATGVEATGVETVSGNLQVTVNVQKAIRLKIEKSNGCDIGGSSSPFTMNFGDVDALGISAGCSGTGAGKLLPNVPGTDAAVYYTDYKITPIFTNQNKVKAEITAYVNGAISGPASVLKILDGATPTLGGLTEMKSSSTDQTSITGSTGVDNKTEIVRYLGVSVSPTSATSGTMNGSATATITYTMTVK